MHFVRESKLYYLDNKHNLHIFNKKTPQLTMISKFPPTSVSRVWNDCLTKTDFQYSLDWTASMQYNTLPLI